MCDYSLECYSSRPAIEGERLVIHRFSNGIQGFVCQTELTAFNAAPKSAWQRLTDWLFARTPEAVCLAPGCRLVLRELPLPLQRQIGVTSEEEVTFIECGSQHTHRDALRFRQGTSIPVQALAPGQVADVLTLAPVIPQRESEAAALPVSAPHRRP